MLGSGIKSSEAGRSDTKVYTESVLNLTLDEIEKICERLFNLIDKDGNGVLTKSEFRAFAKEMHDVTKG